MLSRGDVLIVVGLAKAIAQNSGQSTLSPENMLAGALLAYRQGHLFEAVPVLEKGANDILKAAKLEHLKVDDITEPLTGKTLPLDERVKAALKINARKSLDDLLSSLMAELNNVAQRHRRSKDS